MFGTAISFLFFLAWIMCALNITFRKEKKSWQNPINSKLKHRDSYFSSKRADLHPLTQKKAALPNGL